MALWRVRAEGEIRLAVGAVADGPRALLPRDVSVGELLAGPAEAFAEAASGTSSVGAVGACEILAPVDEQEVWAAGLTFPRSRDARNEESGGLEHYDWVYDADRPELFFKAAGNRVRGTGETIGIRADSHWNVPEPELGLVIDSRRRIVGYVIGNDVSSRSIEAENPLYLPQAKVYTGSCAIGPCLVPVAEAPPLEDMEITLRIDRDGQPAVHESFRLASMRRTVDELVDWLHRASDFPRGVVLLTGTSIVPDSAFSLAAGDEVTIAISGLGTLRNLVAAVGQAPAPASAVGDQLDQTT